MSRISITLAAAIGITACLTLSASAEVPEQESCVEPPSGTGQTNIIYRDSHLQATPVTKIGKGKLWRFKLTTPPYTGEDEEVDVEGAYAPAAYDDAIVTIKGKTGSATDKWLHVSGTRDDSPLIVCVPDWLREDQTVFFTVTVESLGMLDPRGDVVN